VLCRTLCSRQVDSLLFALRGSSLPARPALLLLRRRIVSVEEQVAAGAVQPEGPRPLSPLFCRRCLFPLHLLVCGLDVTAARRSNRQPLGNVECDVGARDTALARSQACSGSGPQDIAQYAWGGYTCCSCNSVSPAGRGVQAYSERDEPLMIISCRGCGLLTCQRDEHMRNEFTLQSKGRPSSGSLCGSCVFASASLTGSTPVPRFSAAAT